MTVAQFWGGMGRMKLDVLCFFVRGNQRNLVLAILTYSSGGVGEGKA